MTDHSEIAARFPYGVRYSAFVCLYPEIEFKVPKKPGLYSWHIRIKHTDGDCDLEKYEMLFQHTQLWAKLTSHFNLRYEGKLHIEHTGAVL